MLVCLADNGVRGLAMGRPRAGKLAWDVEDLFVAEGAEASGVDLLEQLSAEVAKRGGRRMFLATPVDGESARIAGRAGFIKYTTETLFSLRPTGPIDCGGSRAARPRLRQDTQGLFQLYNAVVPCRVRSAEAMTIDEWSSLDRGSRLWAPSLGGNRQHFVWESQESLVGWLQLTFGAKSQHMVLLVHPSHRAATGDMLRYSLSQASHRVPVYVSAREYQPELISALEGLGFSRVADHLIYSRELAARVPNRILVPARA